MYLIQEDRIIRENIIDMRFLLTEQVSREELIDAIENHKILYIYYVGSENVPGTDQRNTVMKGFRTIEPYAIGMSTAGHVVLRAWQQAGSSDSHRGIGREPRPDHDILPGWRLFYVQGITSILPTGKKFNISGSNPRPNYNPNDKQMTDIYAAVGKDDKKIEIDGIDSIEEPDSVKREVPKSEFDIQTDNFKKFYNKSQENKQITKNKIIDLYQLIKRQYKKSPKNYIVVLKNGIFWIDNEKNRGKYRSESIVGNLNDLFVKYTGIANKRVPTSFFDQQRKNFLKK